MDGSSVPAAIFDLDGVILNTVASLYTIYTDILDGIGVRGSRVEFDRLNGCNLDEIVSFLARRHGLQGQEDVLRGHFESRFSQLYTLTELVPGIVPVLETLKREGVTICLASSASQRSIDAALRKFDLEPFFDAIVSGDDVVRART